MKKQKGKSATQTGAVYSSTTVMAPPLRATAYWVSPKKAPTPQTPKPVRQSA